MIARVEFTYDSRKKLVDLAKSDEIYAQLKAMLTDCPEEDRRADEWSWSREQLIDLNTDGRWFVDHGVEFAIKKFKGTMELKAITPGGVPTNVYVQVPHVGLLAINEVEVEEDCCTDALQRKLNEGWRIICVCPPNAARRPDYILGRTNTENK